MKDHWRETARAAIEGAIADFATKCDLENLSDSQKRELRIWIDAAYPFQLRKNYPWQAWQDERRQAFDKYQLENFSTSQAQQQSLF